MKGKFRWSLVAIATVGVLEVSGCGLAAHNQSANPSQGSPRMTTSTSSNRTLPKQMRENMMPFKYSSAQMNEIQRAAKQRGLTGAYIPSMVDVQGEAITEINAEGKHTPLILFSNFALYESTSLETMASLLGVQKTDLTKQQITLPTGRQAWWGDFTSHGVRYQTLYVRMGTTHVVVYPLMNKQIDTNVLVGIASTLRSAQ